MNAALIVAVPTRACPRAIRAVFRFQQKPSRHDNTAGVLMRGDGITTRTFVQGGRSRGASGIRQAFAFRVRAKNKNAKPNAQEYDGKPLIIPTIYNGFLSSPCLRLSRFVAWVEWSLQFPAGFACGIISIARWPRCLPFQFADSFLIVSAPLPYSLPFSNRSSL